MDVARAAAKSHFPNAEVNGIGLIIDIMRAHLGWRFDEMLSRGYGTIEGRAARISMQLEMSRPTENDRTCFSWVSYFERHHAHLQGGPRAGKETWWPQAMNIDHERKELVFDDGELVFKNGSASCLYVPLDTDPLFHLMFCGGMDLQLTKYNIKNSSIFVDANRDACTLRAAWPEFWSLAKANVLRGNSRAMKRSGNQGEVYLALAAAAASHSGGFAVQPRLDEFTSQLLGHLTGKKVHRVIGKFRELFAWPDPSGYPTVPFASPPNTPWPQAMRNLFASCGIMLGDSIRPDDDASVNFQLGEHFFAESKNHSESIDMGVFQKVVELVPKNDFRGVYFFLTHSELTKFQDPARILRALKEKRAKAVIVSSVNDSKEEITISELFSERENYCDLEDNVVKKPEVLFVILELIRFDINVS